MFLRSLTLRGFKSFADKTTLEFAPGISVIVGPNGSGKSNIADAIAWVLGEQGPRALRGAQMADVIFAGTSSRPALGMAEVRVVIDNSAGLIPIPASEIEISRAVFRSGESEYRLGGRPCRLLDIQELLSDTGIGRALHTLIGQGQLDSVLSARAEDRRQLIEEAAGVAKHRRRRERAERKLAGLEQDLLRLKDLVAELRRQLKPLKQQAELAQRHEELTRHADELARALAAARLRDLLLERDRRAPSWRRLEEEEARSRQRLAELDGTIGRLEAERAVRETSVLDAESLQARMREERSRAKEALQEALGEESRARDRLHAATGRSGRLFALEEEQARNRAALEEVEEALEQREAELQAAERRYLEAADARRDAEDERRRLSEDAAARRAEAEALERAVAANQAEVDRLAALLGDLQARMEAGERRAAELEAEIERLDARETPLAERQAVEERRRSELAGRIAELETREQALLARQRIAEARAAELAESPAAAFVRTRGSGSDATPIGILRQLIEAPADLQVAIRSALGPFADAVVYASHGEAVAEASAPGALGLTLAVARASSPQTERPTGEGLLLAALRPDPRVADLVGELLTDVYLVSNAAEAEARHRVRPDAVFVSRDGMAIGRSFVRPPPGHDVRLDEARRESAGIERELGSVRRALREAGRDHAEVSGSLEGVRAELDEIDGLITVAAESMAVTRSELGSARREHGLVAGRLAAVRTATAAARDRLAASLPSIPELPPLPPRADPPNHLRVEVEALRRERARLEAGVSRAAEEIATLGSEDPAVLRAVLQMAEAKRARAESALLGAEGNLDGAAAAYRATTEAAREVQAQEAEANRAWRECSGELDRLRVEHEEEARERHDLERRVAEAKRLLHEGHGVDPAGALRALAPTDTVEEVQRRAEGVARRLGLLGRVNLLATGELQAVQERHDFVARELQDVQAARRDLHQVIQEVDLRMAELFSSAFRDVSREFSALFELMFPGGEGRLVLTDADEPLGSGVDVQARPGRGRVKRLSLLSGGERSLAALAFLFAIFRARPSPFYLMDEVEAALDDVNLHRFLEVVKGFAETSQIILVTHQKRTMEAADVLYGVSMGRSGVSTVISQRLSEVAAV